jgi:hypothetical protein
LRYPGAAGHTAPILIRGLQALAAAIPPEIFAAPEGLRRIAAVE